METSGFTLSERFKMLELNRKKLIATAAHRPKRLKDMTKEQKLVYDYASRTKTK